MLVPHPPSPSIYVQTSPSPMTLACSFVSNLGRVRGEDVVLVA